MTGEEIKAVRNLKVGIIKYCNAFACQDKTNIQLQGSEIHELVQSLQEVSQKNNGLADESIKIYKLGLSCRDFIQNLDD